MTPRNFGQAIMGALFLVAAAAAPAGAVRVTPFGTEYGAPDVFLEFHGFGSIEGYAFEDQGRDNGVSTFDINNLYLIPSAHLSPKLEFKSTIEFEHGGSEIVVDKLYLQYAPLSKPSQLSIFVGEQFVPFSRELDVYQAPLRLLVDRTATAEVLGFDEFFDIGVKIAGVADVTDDIGIIYNAGVYNGTRITENLSPPGYYTGEQDLRDVNNSKMFVGRLGMSLFNGKAEVSMGALYDRNWAVKDTPIPFNLETLGFSGYGEFTFLNIIARYEWLQRKWHSLDGAAHHDAGWYAQVAYSWKPDGLIPFVLVRPAIQADSLHRDGTVSTRVAGGLAVFPLEYLQIKVEYQVNMETPEMRNNGVLAAVVAEF